MSGINYSFSINYGVPSQQREDTDLFAFDDCTEYPLSPHQSLVRSKRTGKQGIVTSDVLFALRQCTEFRTWEEQIEAISRVMPSGTTRRNDIYNVLQGAKNTGLLISARAFLETISPVDAPTSATNACYCIITCDRPAALSRLLQSFSSNHRFDSGNSYFVIDDSRKKDNRQQNRAIVERFREANATHYRYFGKEEQQTFLETLRRMLPPEHHGGLEFLLGRHEDSTLPSHGRSRNWAFLLGKGKHPVLLDDDILFERRIPRNASQKIQLGHHSREVDFFNTPEGWQSYALSELPDPTADAALALTGKTLPQAVGYLGKERVGPSSLQDTSSRELQQLSSNSRVLVTACGHVGDPGTGSSQWLFELEGASQRRLLSSESNYRYHMTERNTWIGSPTVQFAAAFTMMSGLTVLDGSTLFPPYFPLLRNEDLLFGGMVQKLYPEGLLADLPWAVPHLPMEKRQWDHTRTFQPGECGFLQFCAGMLLNNCSGLQLAPESRLVEISQIFNALATMNDEDLLRKLGEQTMLQRSARVFKLSRSLEEAEAVAPEQWRHDVMQIIKINRSGLQDETEAGFADLPRDEQGSLQSARFLLGQFAEALQSWPTILAAARHL